jgi:hypothetical protein
MRYILAALVAGLGLGSAAYAADAPKTPEPIAAPAAQSSPVWELRTITGCGPLGCSTRQVWVMTAPQTAAPPMACSCGPACSQGGTCQTGQCGMAGCSVAGPLAATAQNAMSRRDARVQARLERRSARRGG